MLFNNVAFYSISHVKPNYLDINIIQFCVDLAIMKLVILFLVLACFVTVNTRRPFRPWASGRKCTGKVINFCKRKCSQAECENHNKKEPKGNSNKRKYCRKVKCVKPGRNRLAWHSLKSHQILTPAFTILSVRLCLTTKDKLTRQNVEYLSDHLSDLIQI